MGNVSVWVLKHINLEIASIYVILNAHLLDVELMKIVMASKYLLYNNILINDTYL